MKLISFAHYTCGGLLCDILNDTYSPIGNNGGIQSIHHSIGKIGDSDSVLLNFDQEHFKNLIDHHRNNQYWIGTHCWLGNVDLSDIDRVINITTLTYRSRLYRWVRAYHHYYLESQPWQDLMGIDCIDKQRETAKNYLRSFDKISHYRVTNLEFSDVVEHTAEFMNLIPTSCKQHLDRWRQVNHFLYAPDLWRSTAANRFHEAEHEVTMGQRYVYQ